MRKADKIDALKKLKWFVQNRLGQSTDAGILAGLCDIIRYSSIELDGEQKAYLLKAIPKHSYFEYVWRERAKAPRIRWINGQLKKLEGIK